MRIHHTRSELLIRNIIFGVEDGLVSTVGLLSGIAIAGVARSTILLTGFVLIAVEAFSMGVGSLLTEHSVEEYETGREGSFRKPFLGGIVMFVSYVLAGLVPLLPYVFSASGGALYWSVGLSLVALFMLGFFAARRFKVHPLRQAVEMFIIGGLAIVVGVVVGRFIRI